ncbi:hypothetical protein D0T56_01490 [Dysgonomonas sp. 520]|nr:hypothetical protein [Dysgonomonas sp. 520]
MSSGVCNPGVIIFRILNPKSSQAWDCKSHVTKDMQTVNQYFNRKKNKQASGKHIIVNSYQSTLCPLGFVTPELSFSGFKIRRAAKHGITNPMRRQEDSKVRL